MMLKVKNIKNKNGKSVPNQFIIRVKTHDKDQVAFDTIFFQSYDSLIVKKSFGKNGGTYLDKVYWDYSKTTGKYRNIFLAETKKETEKKIKSGECKLTNLN